MKNYRQFKYRLLKNPQIKKAYKELGPEFEVVTLLLEMRLKKHITQREVAKRAGTKQSAISRFESGTYNPSLSFLYKVADALNAELKVSVNTK